MARAVARRAIARTRAPDVLLALGVILGVGLANGCARSHVRDPFAVVGSPDAAVFAGAPDAGDPDRDGDGYPESVDCDDTDASIHPGATEDPCVFDGIDQNCDGWDVSAECDPNPECRMWLCNG